MNVIVTKQWWFFGALWRSLSAALLKIIFSILFGTDNKASRSSEIFRSIWPSFNHNRTQLSKFPSATRACIWFDCFEFPIELNFRYRQSNTYCFRNGIITISLRALGIELFNCRYYFTPSVYVRKLVCIDFMNIKFCTIDFYTFTNGSFCVFANLEFPKQKRLWQFHFSRTICKNDDNDFMLRFQFHSMFD